MTTAPLLPDDDCVIRQISEDGEDDGLTWFHCDTHDMDTLDTNYCEGGVE